MHDKYATDDLLYPKNDYARRATINQRLLFDQGTLYKSFTEYYDGKFKKWHLNDKLERSDNVAKAFRQFDMMLNGWEYAAGDRLSLADFSLIASISSFVVGMDYDLGYYPNVAKWYAKVRLTIPGKELNEAGLEAMKIWMDSLNQ